MRPHIRLPAALLLLLLAVHAALVHGQLHFTSVTAMGDEGFNAGIMDKAAAGAAGGDAPRRPARRTAAVAAEPPAPAVSAAEDLLPPICSAANINGPAPCRCVYNRGGPSCAKCRRGTYSGGGTAAEPRPDCKPCPPDLANVDPSLHGKVERYCAAKPRKSPPGALPATTAAAAAAAEKDPAAAKPAPAAVKPDPAAVKPPGAEPDAAGAAAAADAEPPVAATKKPAAAPTEPAEPDAAAAAASAAKNATASDEAGAAKKNTTEPPLVTCDVGTANSSCSCPEKTGGSPCTACNAGQYSLGGNATALHPACTACPGDLATLNDSRASQQCQPAAITAAPAPSGPSTGVIVGAVLGSLLGLALLTALIGALVCCVCCRRRNKKAAAARAAKLSLPQHKAGAAAPAAGANGHHSPGSRQPSGQLHYDHYDTPGKVLVGTAGAAGLAAAGATAATGGAGGSARNSSARSFNYYDSPQHLTTAASSPLPPGRQQSSSYGRSSSMPVRAGGLAAAAAGIGAGAGAAATLVGAGEAGATGGSSHSAAAAEAAARRPAYADSDSDDEQEGTRGGGVPPTLPTARASDPGPLSSSSGGGGYFSKARLGAGAVAATGAAALTRAWGSNSSNNNNSQLQPSAGASYGSEDLVAGLNEMKYIINNRLLLLVDDSTLSSDPLQSWLLAGFAGHQPRVSHPSYAASDALIEDWCANKVWFWLNDKFWAFLPSGQRLFNAQVSSGTSTRDYARQVLAAVRANPQYQPLAASAAEAADDLLQDAARSSRPSSSGLGVLGGGSDVSRGQRWRDQGGLAGPSDALVAYYRPVLTKLMEAALRFYLQVQATADSALVLVPGSKLPVSVSMPEKAVMRKDFLGSAADVLLLCERPGVVSIERGFTSGVNVLAPAQAIRVGLR